MNWGFPPSLSFSLRREMQTTDTCSIADYDVICLFVRLSGPGIGEGQV